MGGGLMGWFTLTEITQALEGFNEEDLLTINETCCAIIKHKRATKNLVAKAQFNVGDAVTWKCSRKKSMHYGKMLTGVIKKINRSKCEVKQDDSTITWTIPFSMLQVKPSFNPLTGEIQ